MNVSEKVRALLAQKREDETGLPAYLGLALEEDRRRKRSARAGRGPSGRDLRRWARSQERAGVKEERKPVVAAEVRRRRGAALSARELFPVLRAKRLAARPVVGYTAEKEPVFGVSTFRNVLDENGKHI